MQTQMHVLSQQQKQWTILLELILKNNWNTEFLVIAFVTDI